MFLVSHFFVEVQYGYQCTRPYVHLIGGVNMVGKLHNHWQIIKLQQALGKLESNKMIFFQRLLANCRTRQIECGGTVVMRWCQTMPVHTHNYDHPGSRAMPRCSPACSVCGKRSSSRDPPTSNYALSSCPPALKVCMGQGTMTCRALGRSCSLAPST